MSLQVDLLYPGEQRSGSLITLRSVLRVSAIIVPLLAAMLIGAIMARAMLEASALAMLETHWETTERRQKKALQLAVDLGRNREILQHLQGWESASLPWAPQLSALIETTPPTIQLRLLSARAGQALPIAAAGRDRRFSMRLTGNTREETATESIAALRRAFTSHSAWAERVESALVVKFAQDDTPGADSRDRVFELEIIYNPLSFE